MIRFRELNEEDVFDYCSELSSLFDSLHKDHNYKLNQWFLWLKAQGKLFGAFENEKLIGMITVLLIPKPYASPNYFVAQIEDVAIHHQYRKQGIGTRFLQYVIHQAKQNHWSYKIILNTSDENVHFYENVGFKKSINHMRIDI